MKRGIALGLLVGILFALFVMVKDLIGVNAFYMAAVAVAMFAVLGPFGDYFKAGLSMLIGVVVGLAGILILLVATPLPPENLVYVALVSGVSLFLMVLVSTTGLRIDAMFLVGPATLPQYGDSIWPILQYWLQQLFPQQLA